MKVFVTGATGYLGSELVRALHRAGHEPVGLARSDRKLAGLEPLARWVFGNLREASTYQDAAAACDAVVHMGAEYGPDHSAVDALAVRTLVSACRSHDAARTLVYTSGVWVLGNTGDRPADEGVAATHPAGAVAWRPAHEHQVLGVAGGHLTTAIVRPGMVFGGKGGTFEGFFHQAEQEGAPVVVGEGKNRWSSVHAEDVMDLYLRILEQGHALRSQPPGAHVFHAVSATETVAEIAAVASRAASRGGSVRFWPVAEAHASLGLVAEALALDQVVAATRSERVLGWRPRWRGFVPNAAEVFERRRLRA